MSAFFEKQPPVFVYGDGDGNIVFEEWSDNDCSQIVKSFSMSIERFKDVIEFHFDDLCSEAYHNPAVQKAEKND